MDLAIVGVAAAAVFSALHDATGIWFKEQPVSPEKTVRSLKEKGIWGTNRKT
jgi:CO/xanthine dehydrogenase Mo-binding subunit